jgi:RNA polymerase sigma factor (sigma-70 family)
VAQTSAGEGDAGARFDDNVGSMDPDLALLERWRGGDRPAGEQLFARHFDEIYRFFEHKVGGEADDLAQRTFLACVAAREQFRGQSSFRTYLFTIARHELFAYLRRRPLGDQLDFDVSSIAELATSPSARVGRSQKSAQLRVALSELPAEQQLILELHYWHELDAAALGEVLGATAATIRVRLLRARRALKERLAKLDPSVLAEAGRDPLVASLSQAEPEER